MAQSASRFNVNSKFSNWWYNQKNKIIKNIRTQDFLAKFPITSRIARKEGEAIFQLMTGFVDTQILFSEFKFQNQFQFFSVFVASDIFHDEFQFLISEF